MIGFPLWMMGKGRDNLGACLGFWPSTEVEITSGTFGVEELE